MHDRTRRIFDAIVPTAEGCWPWPTSHPKGYGTIQIGKRRHGAHRVVYEELVGPIDDGLTLDHLCRNRCCVNPAHLEPVTNHENILRGIVPTANRELCKNGWHLLVGVGVFIDSEGVERCRQCRLDSKRAFALRRAAA